MQLQDSIPGHASNISTHLLILFFSVFFSVPCGYFMSFDISNFHMNNLSNNIAFTIKQLADDKLLSFIALNAKT